MITMIFLKIARFFWFNLTIKPKPFVLRLLGAKIGKDCLIYTSIFNLDIQYAKRLILGDRISIAKHAIFFFHDAAFRNTFGLKQEVSTIRLENNVLIGAGAIVLPGVKIGKNTIVGAGAVVTKSFGSNLIIAGNPAKEIISKVK